MKQKKQIIYKKNRQLSIYKRDDDKSGNYYGRCHIQGRDKIKSSGVSNKKQAIEILEDWFDELRFKDKHNMTVHKVKINTAIEQYLEHISKSNSIASKTKKSIRFRMNRVARCKEFTELNIETCHARDIGKTYLKWILNQKSNRGATYRGASIKGDLVTISGLMTWAYETDLRTGKIGSLTKLLAKDLRQETTSRTHFTKEEYKHLLSVSRKRYQNGDTERVRFDRYRLHQFILFMVGTGLRVESECMKLNWDDIEFIDRRNVRSINKEDTEMKHHDRYFIKINVHNSKVKKTRVAIGMSSAYDSLMNLKKLYVKNDIECTGNIWRIQSFRTGLNELLLEANLKTSIHGNTTTTRDSVSFRKTFMCFMIDRGIHHHEIAKQCGTSIEMIDRFYAVYKTSDNLIDKIIESNSKN